MLYTCGRCGKNKLHLGDLKKHLKTKKVCDAIYSNIDRNALLEALQTTDGKSASKNLNIVSNNIVPFEDIENPQDFVTNLQHSQVKMKHEIIKLREENAELKTKLYALQMSGGVGGNVTNNNTNNNNIQINIINNFGKENMDYITPGFINRTIQKVYESIPTLLKHIHFNPEHPENHNVRLPNKRDKYMLVRRMDEWKHELKRDVLDSLVKKAHYYLNETVDEEAIDKLSGYKRTSIDNYRKRMDDEDEDCMRYVQSRVEVMILDARSPSPSESGTPGTSGASETV